MELKSIRGSSPSLSSGGGSKTLMGGRLGISGSLALRTQTIPGGPGRLSPHYRADSEEWPVLGLYRLVRIRAARLSARLRRSCQSRTTGPWHRPEPSVQSEVSSLPSVDHGWTIRTWAERDRVVCRPERPQSRRDSSHRTQRVAHAALSLRSPSGQTRSRDESRSGGLGNELPSSGRIPKAV